VLSTVFSFVFGNDKIDKGSEVSMPEDRLNKVSCNNYSCEVEVFLGIVSGKWVSLILWELGHRDILRFNELQKAIPGVTQKMLTQQLRFLEKNGIVIRTVYPEVPPVVEYTMTEMGKKIIPVFEMMDLWGKEYVEKRAE